MNSEIVVKTYLNTTRFTKQFEKAQYLLDSEIMNSMVPMMPMVTGNFINLTRARSASLAGTGTVCAGAAPLGHYLYEGKSSRGKPLVYTGAGVPGRYYKGGQYDKAGRYYEGPHPEAGAKWFERAKEKYGDIWVMHAKRMAGNGTLR